MTPRHEDSEQACAERRRIQRSNDARRAFNWDALVESARLWREMDAFDKHHRLGAYAK